MALAHDPLWPRAGGWPTADDVEGTVDASILGIPAFRTSLSPTGAHATPGAVREALARYSATLMGPPAVDLGDALRIVDAGDVEEPDGPEGEERVRGRVAELASRSGLVVGIGGDNSITYAMTRGMRATGLITLDAHFDLRDGVSNGSPVRRLVEGGLDGRRGALLQRHRLGDVFQHLDVVEAVAVLFQRRIGRRCARREVQVGLRLLSGRPGRRVRLRFSSSLVRGAGRSIEGFRRKQGGALGGGGRQWHGAGGL